MIESVRKKFLQRMTRIDFSKTEWGAAAASAILLILSFPNFEVYPLAWIGLVPLLVVVAKRPSLLRAFILGWAVGSVFFYATCYWLTYSMIHYGGLPAVLAYLLLVPGALVIGVFHGVFASEKPRLTRTVKSGRSFTRTSSCRYLSWPDSPSGFQARR